MARLSETPVQLMSRILDAVPARVPPERTILFFPAPYNGGCNGTHTWMAQATTLAIERQAGCGLQNRTIVVRRVTNGGCGTLVDMQTLVWEDSKD